MRAGYKYIKTYLKEGKMNHPYCLNYSKLWIKGYGAKQEQQRKQNDKKWIKQLLNNNNMYSKIIRLGQIW